jgi:hypothetical protein
LQTGNARVALTETNFHESNCASCAKPGQLANETFDLFIWWLKAESPYCTALVSRQKLWINEEGFWTSPPKASFILFSKMNFDPCESPWLLFWPLPGLDGAAKPARAFRVGNNFQSGQKKAVVCKKSILPRYLRSQAQQIFLLKRTQPKY